MGDYEITYILKPSFTEAEWTESRDYVNNWIKSHEGAVQKEDVWGLRPLATELEGERQGYYVILYFSLPEQHVADFRFNLNIHDRMFRFMLMKRIPEPVAKAAK